MLNKAKALRGHKLQSLDGETGKVRECYCDDRHWISRYLVADTGNWLTGREVLISPYALTAVEKKEQYVVVALTKRQIEDSPPLDDDKLVSRQFEDAYYGYYGWPTYRDLHMWEPYLCTVRDCTKWTGSVGSEKVWDHHLLSTHDVSGHDIQATDGEICHVQDFIIDEET